MRFAWLLALLVLSRCWSVPDPNVPSECSDGTANTPECVDAYERVWNIFHSEPRWGIWVEPFYYLAFRDPLHDYSVRRARHELARWGEPEAAAHAVSELRKVGAKREALEDLITLGPIASKWIPEVRAFHRRHQGQRWGMDVLALVSMGAPEGLRLLEEGLRSPANPGAYFPPGVSENITRAFEEPSIEDALRHLKRNDPRYRVRETAHLLFPGTEDNADDKLAAPLPTCFSDYVYDRDSATLSWADSTATLAMFPPAKSSNDICDDAPRENDWLTHAELLGECAVIYHGHVQPGRVAVYPRDREPYTLLEEEYPKTVLEWNGAAWIVSVHTHDWYGAGGLLRVSKDQTGYLRITEHIDLGGAPLAFKEEPDGSLLVLSNRMQVYGSFCEDGEADHLDLVRINPDLSIESVP